MQLLKAVEKRATELQLKTYAFEATLALVEAELVRAPQSAERKAHALARATGEAGFKLLSRKARLLIAPVAVGRKRGVGRNDSRSPLRALPEGVRLGCRVCI